MPLGKLRLPEEDGTSSCGVVQHRRMGPCKLMHIAIDQVLSYYIVRASMVMLSAKSLLASTSEESKSMLIYKSCQSASVVPSFISSLNCLSLPHINIRDYAAFAVVVLSYFIDTTGSLCGTGLASSLLGLSTVNRTHRKLLSHYKWLLRRISSLNQSTADAADESGLRET